MKLQQKKGFRRCFIEPFFLGNLKIVKLLVEHGAEDIETAMNLAEANGKLKKVNYEIIVYVN